MARIYFIDSQIASGKYPNANFLAEEDEVGTATIYRDIEYMKDMLNAPIEYGKVLSWVLSFGATVKPVKPPQLVKEWRETILELYDEVK